MSDDKEEPLTMCWFGFYQPYATSVVHIPEQVISPKEIGSGELIFIWDKYMKADVLTALLGTPVPWSPALIEGYAREWVEKDDGSYTVNLLRKEMGTCLGAVLLISRLAEDQLNPLKQYYDKKGYVLKKVKALVGDLTRDILGFLPK